MLIKRLKLVSIPWQLKLAWHNWKSQKIKVGFGPITTGENNLAERKWRIDPIINRINALDGAYSAGFFMAPQEMKKFDINIIVKKFNPSFVPIIRRLKGEGKRFIYDIVDNPNSGKKYRYYFGEDPEFSGQMDGFILSSPLHEALVQPFSNRYALIEHPVIHQLYKEEYCDHGEIAVLAQGYAANLKNLKEIEPLIREVAREIGKKIILIYHSEEDFPNSEWVKSMRWTSKNCFPAMINADIAISRKNLDDLYQRCKPSTKVISYMAAGLPVICTPTEADRLVMEQGKTGFFAFQPDEWKKHLGKLASDAALRAKIGRAARESVVEKYSIDSITSKYIALLDKING